ncbi:MAG: hypothetical protein H0X11_08975 [Betaproteobacteria bacterium]|nr:hypothetical protein [Betaproteobacteria bacterium]
MGKHWWGRALWLFALALPLGAILIAFGEVPFIRGLGAFVLADAAAGVALCALALRVLHPEQWRSQLRRLREKARGAHERAERLATSAAAPQSAM